MTTGQTLTNSVNVAEGKSDIAAAPFVLPFLMSRAVGPYANGKEKGAELAANLQVLYTYRIACQSLYAYNSNFPGMKAFRARNFQWPATGRGADQRARPSALSLAEEKDYQASR